MSANPIRGPRNLSVEDARARMLDRISDFPDEIVALADADGRVLAQPVTAGRDQPPFDASAMDGWAVKRADVAQAARLTIVGESAAGRGYEPVLQSGEAVRIFTGAPVPAGADLVVIQENAERDGNVVRMGPVGEGGANIRPRGGDFRAGDTLIEERRRLDPWLLSLAAAAGPASLRVGRRPRIAVLATGEELATPGSAPGPFQIFESGSAGLLPMIRRWGGLPERLAPTGDDASAIAAAVRDIEAEVIVTVGGASVGDYDLVKPALATLGLELDVETVNVRPGKPTWFGRLADGRLVLGLPGNPASAFVCAELFLKPLVLGLQGHGERVRLDGARLAQPLPANGPREHWMRAWLGPDGVTPFPDQDSSLVTVFAAADALLRRLPGAPAAAAGETVDILRLDRA